MNAGVVIVAAGNGERLGHRLRKAMVPLAGMPMVLRAAHAFAGLEGITGIVIVIQDEDRDTLRERWGDELAKLGDVRFAAGGARRQDSVLAGLRALDETVGGALVHDAARPFVEPELVARILEALDENPAVVPVVPATSTVKRVEDDQVIETVDRSVLRLAQTPQAGRRRELIEALECADREGWDVTDDVEAMERAGFPVLAVEDSPSNFKITTAEDLAVAELLMGSRLSKREEPE